MSINSKLITFQNEQLMPDELSDELLDLIRDNRLIEAIKRYREATGASLAEAKEFIDHLKYDKENTAATRNVDSSIEVTDLVNQIVELLKQNKKIEAIRLHREKTGMGLKESKENVERIAQIHGIQPQQAGCLGVILFFLGGYMLTK